MCRVENSVVMGEWVGWDSVCVVDVIGIEWDVGSVSTRTVCLLGGGAHVCVCVCVCVCVWGGCVCVCVCVRVCVWGDV